MKKLKVIWQDGSWNRTGEQPVATALLPVDVSAVHIGEDTLVFREPGSTRIVLIIPEQRLISAVVVDEDEVKNGPPVDPDDLTLWNATLDLRQTVSAPAAVEAADALAAWGDKKGLA